MLCYGITEYFLLKNRQEESFNLEVDINKKVDKKVEKKRKTYQGERKVWGAMMMGPIFSIFYSMPLMMSGKLLHRHLCVRVFEGRAVGAKNKKKKTYDL